MRVIIVAVAVLAASAAQAKPLECVLWPKTCQAPVAIPVVPEPSAPQLAPVQPAPQIESVIPPPPKLDVTPRPRPAVSKRAARPPAVVKPARIKSKFKRKRYTAAELSAMPGLIWPCAAVRFGAAGKSRKQLIAEGRAKNISLNARQLKETCECGVKAACVKGLWS